MTTGFRRPLRAAFLALAAVAAGCAKEGDAPGSGAAAPAAEAAITAEELSRRSPSAALVEAFAAVCAEPARSAVARAAQRREFEPVPAAELRQGAGGVALAEDGAAWRGPAEVAGALLLWDAGTATCEMRAEGVDPAVVGSEFAKLAQTFEEAGASVMRLPVPPARAGAERTRQMLLVNPGGPERPERARVLRFGEPGDAATRDAVALSARGVAAPE